MSSQPIQDGLDEDSQEYGCNVFSEVEFARIEYIGVSLGDLSLIRSASLTKIYRNSMASYSVLSEKSLGCRFTALMLSRTLFGKRL